MSNILFKGILPALVTPFTQDEQVKRDVVCALMEYEYEQGVNGFYINGSTGEGPALGIKTRMELSETVMENNRGRGVVIEHIGAPDFRDAVALTKHAQEVGADAISSLAPNFYFSFTDDELVEYYKRIASCTDKPLLIYVTPLLKTDIVPLVTRLLQIENVIGLKFTLPDYYLLGRLRTLNGGDINILNGPDETLLCGLSMGAHGGIGSTYNVMPDWYVALYNCFTAGDIQGAREYQFKINRVIEILLRYSENGAVKGVKAALECRGFDVGSAVFPSKTYTAAEKKALRAELQAAGLTIL